MKKSTKNDPFITKQSQISDCLDERNDLYNNELQSIKEMKEHAYIAAGFSEAR